VSGEPTPAPAVPNRRAAGGVLTVVCVTSGALGDVLGRRKVFPAGLALFVGSCALIALSANGVGVVGGRMMPGASGATILACSSPRRAAAAVNFHTIPTEPTPAS
jgi:MFS family permease